MRNYCIINGVNSNTIGGLLIQELPSIQKPRMRTQTQVIDGRDGDIITPLGYQAYDKEMLIGLYGSYDVDDITAFFNTSGTIIFSNEPTKVYQFTLVDEIDYERLARFREAKVSFHVQPFKSLLNETEINTESVFNTDKVPYTLRKSGGDVVSKNAEYDTIVGGTIAWNQQFNTKTITTTSNEVTFVADGEKVVATGASSTTETSFNAQNSSVTFIKDHVYLLLGAPSGGSTSTYDIYYVATTAFGSSGDTRLIDTGNGKISKAIASQTSSNARIYVNRGAGTVTNLTFIPQLFDLTQMFGTEIADYILSLEQANEGDGVVWFKNLFPNDYYAYDTGTLMSVNTSEHKMVGFNAFDKSKASANKDLAWASGLEFNETKSIVSDYIPIVIGEQYYTNYRTAFFGYDANKNYVGAYNSTSNAWTKTSGSIRNDITVANGTGIAYLRLSYRADYNNDIDMTEQNINFNFSDTSKDGTYEPYTSQSYALDESLTLRGIPKLDGNNKLYYDGDIYTSDGTVTRKYGIVDLGTLSWVSNTAEYHIFRAVPSPTMATESNYIGRMQGFIVSHTYSADTQFGISSTMGDKSVLRNGGHLFIRDNDYSDATAFTSAMSGIYLVYELATPTTETADSFENPQWVSEHGTEEYVDYAETQNTRDVAIPVGHETKYPVDIVVNNTGNVVARPVITIYGQGVCGLYLNNNQMLTFNIDSGYITLDFTEMEAYTGGVLKNRQVTGDMSAFYLPVGSSTLSFSGNVTNVIISKYNRWV